jgi:hypothetical protein
MSLHNTKHDLEAQALAIENFAVSAITSIKVWTIIGFICGLIVGYIFFG